MKSWRTTFTSTNTIKIASNAGCNHRRIDPVRAVLVAEVTVPLACGCILRTCKRYMTHWTNQTINTTASIVAKTSTGTISALYWKTPTYWLGSELNRLSASDGTASTSTQGASS